MLYLWHTSDDESKDRVDDVHKAAFRALKCLPPSDLGMCAPALIGHLDTKAASIKVSTMVLEVLSNLEPAELSNHVESLKDYWLKDVEARMKTGVLKAAHGVLRALAPADLAGQADGLIEQLKSLSVSAGAVRTL
eukprot:154641-Prymnesium_polylepis.1